MSLPFVLQRQLADLRVQRLHVRTRVTLLRRRSEHLSGSLHQLGPPLRDLVRMHIVSLCKACQCLVTLHRGYRHLRLEGG